MLKVLYYAFWVLLALIYGIFIFTVFNFYKKKKSLFKYIMPLSLNALISFIGCYILMFSITCILIDFTNWWKHVLLFFGGIIFVFLPNLLLFRLYYKRKNKMSRKEYFIASIYGFLIFILYIVQFNLFGSFL